MTSLTGRKTPLPQSPRLQAPNTNAKKTNGGIGAMHDKYLRAGYIADKLRADRLAESTFDEFN
jgi:hypothetical protein